MARLTVKQDPDKEVPTEILAAAIVAMAEGVKKLRAGRLADRTLCMLIADAAPSYGGHPKKTVGIKDVWAVLEGIESLASTHLKKPPKT